MIYPNKPFYVISGFEPPSMEETRMGMYGFSVGINSDLARKALGRELTQKTYDYFMNTGKNVIKNIGLTKGDLIMPPYHFVQNDDKKMTMLLNVVRVPGDACDLGTDWESIERIKKNNSFDELLEYYPHNVDGVRQAYGLLSLWLNWATGIYATLED